MKDSRLHQTTSSTQRRMNNYNLQNLPPGDHISYNQEIVGRQYGHVKIISPEKRWEKGWRHPKVLVQCTGCGIIKYCDLSFLTRGKSKGCNKCTRFVMPIWLRQRINAAQQRCQNPNDKNYHNYGARGIQFKFASVREAGLWILQNMELPKNHRLQLDRENNEGHYEPGNLRFVTSKVNQSNRRITRIP